MDSVLYDDISFLAEIYSLEDMTLQIAKENVKYVHAYQTIGNVDILTEGFTDSLQKIGNFFKAMIEKIKQFFKKIFEYIDACFLDIDKFVKKYKKELDAVSKVDFTVNGFEWTMHEPPNMEPFQKLVSDYNDAIADASKLKKSDIIKDQDEFLSKSNLDKLRGEILGSKEPIDEDDWSETVRKYYRNGEIDAQSIQVDVSMFRQYVNDADSLVKKKKEAEKTRDDLIVLLDKTQRFFDKKAPVVYGSGVKKIKTTRANVTDNDFKTGDDAYTAYTDSTASAVEAMLRFKYNQANKMASMINLVATERANAYKDQVKMTREIIKRSLFKSSTPEDEKKEA